ncbi:hypothetical protein Dimus_006392 [Dionaea muscipula]
MEEVEVAGSHRKRPHSASSSSSSSSSYHCSKKARVSVSDVGDKFICNSDLCGITPEDEWLDDSFYYKLAGFEDVEDSNLLVDHDDDNYDYHIDHQQGLVSDEEVEPDPDSDGVDDKKEEFPCEYSAGFEEVKDSNLLVDDGDNYDYHIDYCYYREQGLISESDDEWEKKDQKMIMEVEVSAEESVASNCVENNAEEEEECSGENIVVEKKVDDEAEVEKEEEYRKWLYTYDDLDLLTLDLPRWLC